jgi:hypothetical protein
MLSSEQRHDERAGSAPAPLAVACLLLAFFASASPGVVRPALGAETEPAAENAGVVEFHFFWSETCSHCRRARPLSPCVILCHVPEADRSPELR